MHAVKAPVYIFIEWMYVLLLLSILY